jgi:hypothetical protein
MHTFVPCPRPLKPIAHVCTLKMAENRLSAFSALPTSCPSPVINLLSLSFTMLLYLVYRGRWLEWHVESQELGPWVQNSTFSAREEDFPHGTQLSVPMSPKL